jgi:hypothetical protein
MVVVAQQHQVLKLMDTLSLARLLTTRATARKGDDVGDLTEETVSHGDRRFEEVAIAAIELTSTASAHADLQTPLLT